MTLMPEIPQHTPERARMSKERLLGTLALGLVFAASALFTAGYLADASGTASHVVATLGGAEAVATIPSVETGSDPFASVHLFAKSAIVVDVTHQRILYTLNPDAQWPLASLTKVSLALVVAEVLAPDSIITIPYNTDISGSGRLLAGEHWSTQDVIDFTLAVSSNKGADILADAANAAVRAKFPNAPVEDSTLWRMNDLVRQLGLTHTYFLNDNGLDESTTQAGAYGSARDIATLFAYAASTTPATFAATTQASFKLRSVDGAQTPAINTDAALPAIHGIIMGKTGYTDLAGGNLAVVFRSGGNEIVAVVLGSTESGRFQDMETLIADTDKAVAQEP